MPTNEYVEVRNGGYYVAGTRIGLDVVVYDFRRGRSAEAIFEAYPSLGSLAKVYGVITFILEHPAEVEDYLKDRDRLLEEIKAQYPMPQDRIDRFERARKTRRGANRPPRLADLFGPTRPQEVPLVGPRLQSGTPAGCARPKPKPALSWNCFAENAIRKATKAASGQTEFAGRGGPE